MTQLQYYPQTQIRQGADRDRTLRVDHLSLQTRIASITVTAHAAPKIATNNRSPCDTPAASSRTYFESAGTVLNERRGRALIEASLDELRVSLDAANAKSFLAIRGKDYFGRILKNVRAFRNLQEREGKDRPRVSAWLTGLKETIAELPAFVQLAAEIGVCEVYLQRLVFFANDAIGLARPDQTLYEQMTRDELGYLEAAAALARSFGITFAASGAVSEPGMSLERHDDGSPWTPCRRPWTVMYFTANGRALPCCIAPFSQRGYEHYTLGDASQQTLQEIWNGAAYRSFREALLSDKPPDACANCGLRWSL